MAQRTAPHDDHPPEHRPETAEQWLRWARAQRLRRGPHFLLYTLLTYIDWRTGKCFPSQRTLADECHCTVRAVQLNLEALERAKVLKVDGRKTAKGNRGNLYTLAPELPERSDQVGRGVATMMAIAADYPDLVLEFEALRQEYDAQDVELAVAALNGGFPDFPEFKRRFQKAIEPATAAAIRQRNGELQEGRA